MLMRKFTYIKGLCALLLCLILTLCGCSASPGGMTSEDFSAVTNPTATNAAGITTTSRTLVDNPINFEELRSINTDLYAWIEIPDTNINYPVAQSSNEDDNFYLHHNYQGNYGAAAKPYIDAEYTEHGVTAPFAYAPNSGEAALYISKKCENEGRLDAAIKFLHFMTDADSGAQMYVDAVMLGTCIDGVELPEEMAALQDVTYGTYKPSKMINSFKFNAEVSSLYWGMYTEYLDPASTKTAAEFIEKLKDELLPYLEEAIEEYTTYDVLSYADQVK